MTGLHYENVSPAVFLERPNRFIARVLLDGREQICHVKNTGRCRELLVPGATVYLQHVPSSARKTAYDLIAVEKGSRLINMDAAAPNAVFGRWLAAGGAGFQPENLKAECRYGDSRFDFCFLREGRRVYAEVKGVTLERDGAALFPDAPTLRGLKHLRSLSQCVREGMEAWAVFVIQMEGLRYFSPNEEAHPEFALALWEARDAGVQLMAMDCRVSPDSLCIGQSVDIRL